MLDTFGRPLKSLRVSLIDKCNLRCQYCMPEEEYVWLPRDDILTVEEIGDLVDVFSELGVDKVRLTGGEPLLRREVVDVVERLAANPDVRDLSMTTNGVLLAKQAESLRSAGLDRVSVSLDTLRPERFKQLTRRNRLPDVLEGIDAAAEGGLKPLKINTVVMRGYNDDELTDLIDFARDRGAEVRFIEYMDVGGATRWTMDYGPIEPLRDKGSAPANRYALPDGTNFGIIASTTEPFCRACDRSRLTADGMWFLCLYGAHGIDLRRPLREGATQDEIRSLIVRGWTNRADRGAEDRKALGLRGPLYQIKALRKDPHREMHTRGG